MLIPDSKISQRKIKNVLFIEKQQRTQGGGANDNAMVGMNSAVRFAVAC